MDINRIMSCLVMLPFMASLSLPAFSQAVSDGDDAVPVFPERDSTGAYIVPEGYALKDSVIYVPAPAADTLLAGRNIFMELPSKMKGDAADVTVHQSQDILRSMNAHFSANASRQMSGYRVRIFFDNKRTSREESQAVMDRFVAQHHDVPAYRSYVNPYFKVTVGDFRTKSEAMQLLRQIRGEFPAAFIVKEKGINYPVVDKSHAVTADTVQVLYRLPEWVSL